MSEPSTLAAAGGYTCHTDNIGPAPRHIEGGTQWLDIACGHITSELDPGCAGCNHRGKHHWQSIYNNGGDDE